MDSQRGTYLLRRGILVRYLAKAGQVKMSLEGCLLTKGRRDGYYDHRTF